MHFAHLFVSLHAEDYTLMLDRAQTIEKLQSSRQYLSEHYGVSSMLLFGSVARNEQKEDSDVDVCVEMKPNLFNRAGVKVYLEELLGCPLKNINLAITRLQDRSVGINSVNDYLMSPTGMEKLDAACMVLIALGESVKTLDKLTEKKLLPTYPSIDWKGVMGVRDVIAHHYFEVDPDAVYDIIKNDLEPLKKAIDFFMGQLFPKM